MVIGDFEEKQLGCKAGVAASLLALAVLSVACGHASSPGTGRRFADVPVVWQDQDRHPVPEPAKRYVPMYWEAVDQMVFRPLSHAFLFEHEGQATNVNAWDEVPDSSWYQNRMALRTLSPQEVAIGPCRGIELSDEPWKITGGKPDGANPGFVIRDTGTDRAYLLKFDSEGQPERTTAAEVVGARIFWAAGFSAPCNRIVYFSPVQIRIAEGATRKDDLGRERPLTLADVEVALASAPRDDSGRVRASASLLLPGKPLGPFAYEGIRPDDLNDAIPHEDRRELRGSRLLSAWIHHWDARQSNTLTTFIEDKATGLGYVQHHILDFGDSLGSVWFDRKSLSNKFGYSYYVDFEHVLVDFVSLGWVERPWRHLPLYPRYGDIFGYYGVAYFEPEQWKPGYPNVAYNRMQLTDAFWVTKIISRFSDVHIAAIVHEARLSNPRHARYLSRVLQGRRDRIVHHYFDLITALDIPQVSRDRACFVDLVVAGGYGNLADAFYGFALDGGKLEAPTSVGDEGPCWRLPEKTPDGYHVLTASVRRAHQPVPARDVRFHFWVEDGALRLVGIDRT